jgi:ribosome-associated translation inhibitor RaiA
MKKRYTMDETLALGGNIELKGFSGVDKPSIIILKKVIGNYAKKIAERNSDFSKLIITMKPVHEQAEHAKFEIQGNLMLSGRTFNADVTDQNLFYAIDQVLKKLEHELQMK